MDGGEDTGADQIAACFKVSTGEIEDAPGLDPLAKFEISEKDGAVYIKGEASEVKNARKTLSLKCAAKGNNKVLIVGGYVNTQARPMTTLAKHLQWLRNSWSGRSYPRERIHRPSHRHQQRRLPPHRSHEALKGVDGGC